jgi:uncharacterized integral membrane protein
VFIYFGIAIGLVKRNNNSREWAILFISFGVLGILLILAIVIFESQNSTDGFQINFNRLTRPQVIVALVAFLVLHVGMLFTLMRSATKVFFIPQTKQEDK